MTSPIRPSTAPSTTLPATCNTLNAKDRAELVRRTRKLEKVLGVAMHIIDDGCIKISPKPATSKQISKPSPPALHSQGVIISTSTSIFVDEAEDSEEDSSESGDGHLLGRTLVDSTPSSRSTSPAPPLRTKRSLILTHGSANTPILRLQPPNESSTDLNGRDRSASTSTISTITSIDSFDSNTDTLPPRTLAKHRSKNFRPLSLPPSPSSPMSFDEKVEAEKFVKQRQVFTASKLRLTLGENVPVELVLKAGPAGPSDQPRLSPNKRIHHKYSLSLWNNSKSGKSGNSTTGEGPPKSPLSTMSTSREHATRQDVVATTLNVPIVTGQELNEAFETPHSEAERLYARRAAKMAQKFGTPPPSPLFQISNHALFNTVQHDHSVTSIASAASPIRFSSPPSTSTSYQFTIPSRSPRRYSSFSPPLDLIFPLPSPSFSSRTRRSRYSLSSTMSLAEEYLDYVTQMDNFENLEEGLSPASSLGPSGSLSAFSFGAVGGKRHRATSTISVNTVRGDNRPPPLPTDDKANRRRSKSVNEALTSATLRTFLSFSPDTTPSASAMNFPISPNTASPPLTGASDSTFTASFFGNTTSGLKRSASKLSKFFGVDISPESVENSGSSLPPPPPPPTTTQTPSSRRLLRKKSLSRKAAQRETRSDEIERRPSFGDMLSSSASRPSLNLIRQLTVSSEGGRRSHDESGNGKRDLIVVSGRSNGEESGDTRRWSTKNPKEVRKVLGALREMKIS